MKNLITTFLLIAIHLVTMAQNTLLTKQEAIEDINHFVHTAEQVHINLYEKISQVDFLTHKEQLIDNMEEEISIVDFQIKLRELSSLLGDGHTYTHFTKAIYRSKDAFQIFPFSVQFNDEYLVVTQSSTPQLRIGDKIAAIDGKTVAQLQELTKYALGELPLQKQYKIEQNLAFYMQLLYGRYEKVSLSISHGNHHHNTIIALIDEKNQTPEELLYHYQNIGENTGLLTLPTFSHQKINETEYKDFLAKTFAEIQSTSIKKLVIDLRQNGGGKEEYGMQLFPYLGLDSYQSRQSYQVKTSKPLKKYIRKNNIKWFMYPLYPFAYFIKDIRLLLFKKNGTITDIPQSPTPLSPHTNAFDGEVVLLTSSHTYSAAADFTAAFKHAQRGQIIGQNINQPYTGFIDTMPFELPHSKTPAGVAFKRYAFMGTNSTNEHQAITVDKTINWTTFDNIEAIKIAVRH